MITFAFYFPLSSRHETISKASSIDFSSTTSWEKYAKKLLLSDCSRVKAMMNDGLMDGGVDVNSFRYDVSAPITLKAKLKLKMMFRQRHSNQFPSLVGRHVTPRHVVAWKLFIKLQFFDGYFFPGFSCASCTSFGLFEESH